ncbi:MAG: PIN domain-containing protein [Archaeoglobaceae archaeon]
MTSTNLFLDTDVLINWLCEEVDPNDGFKLWEAPYEIMGLVEKGEVSARTSLINIFEIRFVLRRKKKFKEEYIKNLINDLYKQLKIEVPDSIDILAANNFQEDHLLDPFDAIAYSVAIATPSECVVTRDKEFADIIKSTNFLAYSPEEFIENYLSD